MKRTFIVALMVSLVLVLGVAAIASAQAPTPGANCPNGGFVDVDGDGVCDNAPQDGSGQQNGRRSGQQGGGAMGQQRGRQMGQGGMHGQGANFADADGDGQCDNFVDEDGDGVCDNCNHQGQGQGQGQGRGHGRHGQGMGQGMRTGGGQGPRS